MRLGTLATRTAPLVGAVLVVLLVPWRVAAVDVVTGLGVRGELAVDGTLLVEPSRLLLDDVDLRPGEQPQPGRALTVTSIAPRDLRLRPVVAATGHVGPQLHLRATLGGAVVLEGPVAGPRDGRPAVLRPGEAAELVVEVWIPHDAADGFQGRTTELELRLATEPVG